MKILFKLLFFTLLLFSSCGNNELSDYYKIEVYNKRENILTLIITDKLVINSFEKELKILKKKDYLKSPSDFKYFLKCYSKDTVNVYFLNKSYIGKKDGVYPSKVNFIKLLAIE